MIDLEKLEIRQLQTECSRALATMSANNNSLSKYNKSAPHNSHMWYKSVLADYIKKWGDLPSQARPGKDVKLIIDN